MARRAGKAARAASADQHYDRCIANGCSPKLAEMLASRRAPASRTDNDWFRGKGKLLEQFGGNEYVTAGVVTAAKAHGYSPNENDVYMAGLARFTGDPQAFVPACGGTGHVKKLIEDRDVEPVVAPGWESVFGHKPQRDPKPTKKTKLAKDLVDRGVRQLLKKDPGLAVRPVQELRERVTEERSVKVTELD